MGAQARGMLGSVKMEAHDLAEWSYYPEAGEVCVASGMGEREVGGRYWAVSLYGGRDRAMGSNRSQGI